MVSLLQINEFSRKANEAYTSSTSKYLCKAPDGVDVRLIDQPYSFSKEELKQNSDTWKAFRESLCEVNKKKFEWVCQRYRNRINFSRLEASGRPLLPQHIELFSTGSSQVFTWDFKDHAGKGHSSRKRNIKSFSRQELTEKMKWLHPFPVIGSDRPPSKLRETWSSLLPSLIHDKLAMDKKKQLLFSDAAHLSFPSWLERMCKRLVNLELMPKQLIPVPGVDGKIDYYKVYRKVATGDGLVAYALRPAAGNSTLKPLVVFRPTQWSFSNEDAFESYYNDAQPHIGEMGWKAAAETFKELMADPHFRRPHEKISIAGYSLGGAHAQYFLEAHVDHVSNAVFYADPSVDDSTAEQFALKMNDTDRPRRSEPLNIQIYRVKGDFCHYMGGKHVGWGVNCRDVNIQLVEIDHNNEQASALKLHSHHMFDAHHFPYKMQSCEDGQKLFDHLDNSKRGIDVYWYERMRRFWGGAAYFSFYSISWILNVITAVSGLKILRRSNDPDC